MVKAFVELLWYLLMGAALICFIVCCIQLAMWGRE